MWFFGGVKITIKADDDFSRFSKLKQFSDGTLAKLAKWPWLKKGNAFLFRNRITAGDLTGQTGSFLGLEGTQFM